MDLLVGALMAIVIQALKWGVTKIGRENTTVATLGTLFVLTFVWTWLSTIHPSLVPMAKMFLSIVAASVATYELILARLLPLLLPVFGTTKQ